MFVPLPVPFVFQRTAPDLNAWRLKSPLALRSNSGKTFFPLLLSTPPPCRRASQSRPALLCCSEPMRWQRGEPPAHTPTHTRTHTLQRVFFFLSPLGC